MKNPELEKFIEKTLAEIDKWPEWKKNLANQINSSYKRSKPDTDLRRKVNNTPISKKENIDK